jgi:hypothetical protein
MRYGLVQAVPPSRERPPSLRVDSIPDPEIRYPHRTNERGSWLGLSRSPRRWWPDAWNRFPEHRWIMILIAGLWIIDLEILVVGLFG